MNVCDNFKGALKMKMHEEWKWSKHHCDLPKIDFLLGKKAETFTFRYSCPVFDTFTKMYEISASKLNFVYRCLTSFTLIAWPISIYVDFHGMFS